MHDDFEEFGLALRNQGIGDDAELGDAVADRQLAQAAVLSLAGVLARRTGRRRRRRLVGAGAGVAVAALVGIIVQASPTTPSSHTPESGGGVVPALSFERSGPSAVATLNMLTEAARGGSTYGSTQPRTRSVYQWDSSSPSSGRLTVISPFDADQTKVQTFTKPAPSVSATLDMSATDSPDSTRVFDVPGPTAELSTLDALVAAAGADCTFDRAGCALEGLAELRASDAPPHIISDAAAWTALARLADVRRVGSTIDRLGHPAIGIGAPEDSKGLSIVVLVDPTTGKFTGAEWFATQRGLATKRILAVNLDH